jgi:hypothetical protein
MAPLRHLYSHLLIIALFVGAGMIFLQELQNWMRLTEDHNETTYRLSEVPSETIAQTMIWTGAYDSTDMRIIISITFYCSVPILLFGRNRIRVLFMRILQLTQWNSLFYQRIRSRHAKWRMYACNPARFDISSFRWMAALVSPLRRFFNKLIVTAPFVSGFLGTKLFLFAHWVNKLLFTTWHFFIEYLHPILATSHTGHTIGTYWSVSNIQHGLLAGLATWTNAQGTFASCTVLSSMNRSAANTVPDISLSVHRRGGKSIEASRCAHPEPAWRFRSFLDIPVPKTELEAVATITWLAN